MRLKDSTKEKFGKLQPLYRDTSRKGTYWMCQCDCGRRKSISRGCLQSGNTESCGCIRWQGYEEISGNYFYYIARMAKKKGLEFNITKEYIWSLFIQQNRKCILSGRPINFAKNMRQFSKQRASLDRIDNSKGYIVGNVAWVDKELNEFKSNRTTKEFISICQEVVDFQKELLTASLECDRV